MSDLFDLTGKVAMVVGVGGLGHAQAVGFADHGADLVLADINLEVADRVAEDVRARGKKALAIAVDVTQQQSVADMVRQTLEKFPRINILANSFGINRPASELSVIEAWQQVMDVNFRGTFLCCKMVGEEMVKQGSGKIINISSIRGRYSTGKIIRTGELQKGGDERFIATLSSYCSSKGAVMTLTRILASQWADCNVLVNAIAPGIIETNITQAALANPEEAERIKSRIPLGRWAQPEDIVGLSVFLASKASDYITGQVIYLDGGNSAWA